MHPQIVDFQLTDNTTDNIQYFTGYANILKDLSQAFVDIEVLVDSGNEKFILRLNKTINVCDFLINKKSNFFIATFYEIIVDHFEVPKRCPIPKVISFPYNK